jgi:hypothetical protein
VLAALARFTATTAEAILGAKGSGATNEAAAIAGGVTRQALYGWIRRGRQGDPRYIDFVNAFELAKRAADAVRDDRLRAACKDLGNVL